MRCNQQVVLWFSDSDPRVGMPAEKCGDQMRLMLKVGNL